MTQLGAKIPIQPFLHSSKQMFQYGTPCPYQGGIGGNGNGPSNRVVFFMLPPFRDLRKRGWNAMDRIPEKAFEKRRCQIFQWNEQVLQREAACVKFGGTVARPCFGKPLTGTWS
jgi:hypothetical protein